MTSRARIALISALAAGAFCGLAPPAQADHHFMLIREYFPGTIANARDDAFIELQMWTSGQNQTDGHHVYVYGPGMDPADIYTFGPAVPPNSGDQRTILAGGDLVAGRDYPEDIGNSSDPTGGAICFVSQDFGAIDCVEWGAGNANISADPSVAPATIPDGQSIERDISAGCASLLEPGDDTGSSIGDFSLLATPTPRANSVAPTEGPCRSVTFTISGQGTVTGDGINCPGDCSETYPHPAMESWTATPNMGQSFLNWTNCPSGAVSPTCSVTSLPSNLSIAANFSGALPPPDGGGPTTPVTPAPPKKKCKKGQKLKKGKCVKKKRKKK
jgi:hypothetical protein